MILLESADKEARSTHRRLIFAVQLAARGHRIAISSASIEGTLSVHQRYQIAPFLADDPDISPDQVVVLADGPLSASLLARLKSYVFEPMVVVTALGRFFDQQARIDCQNRLAYALGREPHMVDLNDLQSLPLLPDSLMPLAGLQLEKPVPGHRHRLTIALAPDALKQPDVQAALVTLGYMGSLAVTIVTSPSQKAQLLDTLPVSIRVSEIDELSPTTLAQQSDIAVLYGAAVVDEHLGAFALDMMMSGRVVIDATAEATLAGRGAPVLRGPEIVTAILPYLQDTVLPHTSEIERRIGLHDWQKTHGFDRLEKALDLVRPEQPKPEPARTVFLATNGVGLGHARRCLMLAEAMPADAPASFAAFPSCVPLIEDQGYPCLPLVSRSDAHDGAYAHDLVNYLRLRRALRPGDRFVFDGGYVFESIYKTILEKDLAAIWIRRGLWQPPQITAKTIRRECVFRRVIVPAEAFDELNDAYSFGEKVTRVGPIVQLESSDPKAMRKRLEEKFDRSVTELVVTMLGGGVAADRSAQLNLLAGVLERRPGCLHLIVVWPGARVDPGLRGLRNTRVVQTQHALALCRAADLVVSAAGYNSFHECLYHGIPAIFVPQMAPYMDDQTRRARAASDRGLAETVLAHELMRLERTVVACLDAGLADDLRAALARARLPAVGTTATAALIHEVAPC